MTWAYDPNTRLYRDDVAGDTLNRASQMNFMTRSITASHAATNEMAMLNAVGDLTAAQWRAQMREEIKREAIRQYMLGRGGLEQMTARDWGSVGGMISDQYRHLDRKAENFYEQVEAGELSEGETARRARMYISSTREGYERAQERRLDGSRFDEEAWFTTSGESCEDFLDNAQLGWVARGALPSYPGQGKTKCLTNCECYKSYRVADTNEIFGE